MFLTVRNFKQSFVSGEKGGLWVSYLQPQSTPCFLLSYLTDNGNLKGINDATFSLPGRMCGTAMFALYCWASIDLLRWEKRLSPLDFSSLHTRHRFVSFKRGNMVTGAASIGSASSLWSPCLKEKTGFAAFISSVLWCCSVLDKKQVLLSWGCLICSHTCVQYSYASA